MAATDIGLRLGIDGEAEFRSSIRAINAEFRALTAESKAVSAEFAANANSEEALSAKNEVLKKSLSAVKQGLSTVESELDRQREKLAALGTELDQVIAAEGETSKAASKAQNAYNQQATKVANLERQYQSFRTEAANLQNTMEGVEDTSTRAQRALSAQSVLAGMGAWSALEGAVRSASAAIEDAIQTGAAFDSAMASVAATMGTTVDQLGTMRAFALEMGANTAFTATQAAEALNYMALAGYDAQTAMSTLPTVLDLAAAGGVELASASDMITDAQSALGLTLEETTILVDQMAKTSTKSNTSVAQLGEAILTVGGTAKFMAGGTQELNQVLGILADNSIKGAEGGTKLRNIILSLSIPTSDAAAQLDALGVAIFDAEGNMREFSDIFPEMQKALSRLTSQEQIDALGAIFNTRDIAAAQALLGTTAERWEELDAAIQGAAGSAARMAETRLDNLAGDLTLMQSAADGVKIAFSDSLTPALRDAAQAGTGILTVVGSFLTEFPILGNVLAGTVVGVGALTVGMGAMKIASLLAMDAVGGLTGAIMASPVAPFALAIGAGTAALTALAGAADDAGKKLTETAQAIEDSKTAYEQQIQAAAEERQNIEDLAAQLEELAGKENRTAGEKQQLLAVTEQLNQAVPGLSLSYDALNDSLSMTAEEVLALARAQAEAEERAAAAQAVVDAERNHAQAVRELEQAQLDLAAAREAAAKAEADGWAADLAGIEIMGELNGSVKQAEAVVRELEQAVEDSQEQMESAADRLNELAESAESGAEGMDGLSDALEQAGESAAGAAPGLAELEEATLYAAGAADTLSAALKEQEESGSLSLDTTNKLIEAGYAAAISIDGETGAVTLNREEYVRLASAKIQDQIASLQSAKANLESKKALDAAADAADRAGSAYWDAAKAKLAQAYAEDAKAIDVQIAALNRSMKALNSYSGTVTAVSRSSSSASKAVKTQAQKDLEAYKTLKAELDHEKAMDLVSEADYYARLTQLRDQYLTDQANLSDYNKVTEAIYKADQSALQNREKLWQAAGDNILKLEEEFQTRLASRASEIVNSYKLFDQVPEYQKAAGEELIANLEGQIASIQSFYGNLAALEERGVGAGLVEEIRGMGVKASGELEGLLELTDAELSRYANLYEEKQALANQIALEELGKLRADTNDQILEQLDDVAQLYDTNAPALGLSFAQRLADGIFQGMGDVEQAAVSAANAALDAFQRTYNGDVETMMTASKSRVTSDDIGSMLAGAVNGLNAGAGAASYPTVDVTLTLDGDVLARNQVDPLRREFKAKPETLDD